MSGVRLEEVTKRFGKHDPVVRSVSLDIEDGEFVVLVGPSGCGKSTLLRMVAGLEEVGEGRILIGDEDAAGMAPRDRDVAMVFQSYALYPQMTVRANLGFGLRVRKVDKARIRERIEGIARVLGLDELLDRKPAQLSGGQRQRVAIGRAMVREPKVFLMDEPLSNLDAKLRVAMRAELARLHTQLGVTTIYVTHDQVEAMTLGQRVAVLHAGRLQQVDTPHALFNRPANLFVASFIGSPTMNLVHAEIRDGDVRFASHALHLPASKADGPVALGIRPTDFMDARDAPPELPRLTVAVEVVEELGTETYVVFPVDAEPVALDSGSSTGPDEERLLVSDERPRFTARVDSRRSVGVGDHLELAVDNMRLHLFDPANGKRLAAREGA